MVKYEDIAEARETAEMLLNYWDCKDHEQTEYYLGVFNALTWVLRPGSELFADDETAVLSKE